MSQNQEPYQKSGYDTAPEERPVAQSTTTSALPSIPAIKARDRHKNALFRMGITECVMGGLSLVFAIATISMDLTGTGSPHALFNSVALFTYISPGLWCGIFILVTGILGVRAKKNPSGCVYSANMALSIVTAIFTAIGVWVSIVATTSSSDVPRLVTLHALITVMIGGGFIISIVHSAFCCARLCGKRNHPGTVVYITQPPNQQQIGGIPYVQYVVPGGAPSMQHPHNAQSMQPGVYHQVQLATPTQTVYTDQGISPNAQYSGAQSVHHV